MSAILETEYLWQLPRIPMGNGNGHTIKKVFVSEACILVPGWLKIRQCYASIESDPDDPNDEGKEYYRDVTASFKVSDINVVKCSFIEDWNMWQVCIACPTDSYILAFSEEAEAREYHDRFYEAITGVM